MANIRRGEIPVPPHAHPLVRRFVEIANERAMSMRKIGEQSGQHHGIFSNWMNRSNPRLDTFEAALNVLGYEIKIVERA